MRQVGIDEQSSGSELVVRVQERVRPVDDANTVALELGQDLDPGLDAVERLAHVEATDPDVVRAEQETRFRRRQHPGRDPDVAPRVDDPVVGLLRPADDAHELLRYGSSKGRPRHGGLSGAEARRGRFRAGRVTGAQHRSARRRRRQQRPRAGATSRLKTLGMM